MTDKLILDEQALATLGLGDKAVYLIEYDLHSEKKIDKKATKDKQKERKARNKLAREFRNKLIFLLKYGLKATQHLESCWIIDESRLDSAIEGLENLKEKMKAKGFRDVDKRLRIIPILTTIEGIENYDTKKAEFLLNFATEHIAYLEKAKKEKRVPNGIIWRCKKAYEIIAELKEELKHTKRYKELVDTVAILDDLSCQVEAMLKAKRKNGNGKANKKGK
jgi:hypothetical protein